MRKAYSLLLAKRPAEWVDPLRQAAFLRSIEAFLHSQVDPALARHCHVGHWNGHCLTLWADAPVWATKVRYLAPQLINKMRVYKGLGQLSEIKVKVQTAGVAVKRVTVKPPPLSPRAALDMQESAQVVADPKLKAALLRLLGRLKG
ncbi:MAG: DciA family protein [Pseudomonadota bacterium]